ncbi:MAG: hypothetical protein AAGC55_30510, partial [Myxococcota bacterium]
MTAFWLRRVAVIAAGVIALSSGAAQADELQIDPLYAEPDVRVEAAALELLLQANLRDVRAAGRTAGTVSRVGTQLRALVVIYDPDGAVVGRASVTAPASHGDRIADRLAGQITRLLGTVGARATESSRGAVRPFARATRAQRRGDPAAAAAHLDSARARIRFRVPSVRAVSDAVASDGSLALLPRFSAAVLSRDLPAARALVEARLAEKPRDKRARAALARYHLAMVDTDSARAALKSLKPGRDPFVRLSHALLDPGDQRALAKHLGALIRAKYPPALALIADRPPGALPDKLERAVVTAARGLRVSAPGLVAALGVRAAQVRALAGDEAVFNLIEVAWLSRRELTTLERVLDQDQAGDGPQAMRLRAELKLHSGDLDGAIDDLQAALTGAPDDVRLLRHL